MKIFIGGRISRDEFHEIERDVNAIAFRAKADVVARERLNTDPFFERFVGESIDDDEPVLHSLCDVDFFLLCRSFPNEFTVKDVETLRRVNPLAPIVVIAGELCEGEERTGEKFLGVRRYYLGSWRAEGKRQFERFFSPDGSSGTFIASPLATDVDLMVDAKIESSEKETRDLGNVAILADDPGMVELLRGTFADAGYSPYVESFANFDPERERRERSERVFVDVPDLADCEFPYRLAEIRSAFRGAQIVLLTFAPRSDERAYYEKRDLWGKVRVVAKPFCLDDLLSCAIR